MENGDFVEMDFVGRVALTNEIFDLTLEKEAKENNMYDKNHKYKPLLVIIGNNMTIPGVEKELEGMRPGEEKEFEVSPEAAFGKRNQKQVKIISLAKFRSEKISPVLGSFVNIDGMNAKIVSVSGGRVMVDFNHPLAGKVLKYKVKVAKEIKDPLDKARALMDHYGIKCEAVLKDGKLVLMTAKIAQDIVKKYITDTMKKWIKEIKEVEFEEK